MKAELCKAFCDDITVTSVPVGLAVSTAFVRDDGDRVSFYVIEEGKGGKLVIEDDGTTIAMLEAAGVDFDTDTRRRALDELLHGVDGFFDPDAAVIRTRPFPRGELADRAMKFVHLMVRMDDFLLLTPEKVASSFREDASKRIRAAIGSSARIRENETLGPGLSEVKPDMVIEPAGRAPVAVFFGTSSNRVYDAILLQMAATHELKQDVSVIALLEDDSTISNDLRRRASNRLTTVTVFRHDEAAAVSRIVREALGTSVPLAS